MNGWKARAKNFICKEAKKFQGSGSVPEDECDEQLRKRLRLSGMNVSANETTFAGIDKEITDFENLDGPLYLQCKFEKPNFS